MTLALVCHRLENPRGYAALRDDATVQLLCVQEGLSIGEHVEGAQACDFANSNLKITSCDKMTDMRTIVVEVTFSDIVRDAAERSCSIDIKADGSDSLFDIKQKIAVSAPLFSIIWVLIATITKHYTISFTLPP